MIVSKGDWAELVRVNAKRMSKAMELRFDNRMQTTLGKVLGNEELVEDEVVERTSFVMNEFFDIMVGTSVGLLCKHVNSSKEIEDRTLANVRRWFEAMRAWGEKNANN